MDQETTFSNERNLNHPCDQSHVAGEINSCPIEPEIISNNYAIPVSNNSDEHHVDAPNFLISPETLAQLVETNDVNFLQQVGGIQYVAAALETDTQNGINGDQIDLHRRRKAFGSNQCLEGESSLVTKGLHLLLFEAFKDTTIILLLCCAALSLAIGIKRNGPQEGFLDGALIFLAIFAVVNIGVVFRYIKFRLMIRKQLKHKKAACVVRQGKKQNVSASEVVVGDIVWVEKANVVPADGVFIHGGSSFKLDCVSPEASNHLKFPSMFAGSKVAEGDCLMLVTSVGTHTERSKLMRLLRKQQSDHHHYDSKMQIAIDKLSSNLENIWLILSLLVLVVQVLRCFVLESKCDEDHNPDPKGVKNTVEEIMNETTKLMKKQSVKLNGLVAMLCVLIFALRDCLPLGIYTTFLYASKKVKSFKAIVRKLAACATLGLITTICISKTDDIAMQYTKMAELWIGMRIVDDISREVNQQVIQGFQEAIYCTNGSGQEEDDALLFWAQKVLGMEMDELKKSCVIIDYNEVLDLHRSNSTIMVPSQGKEPWDTVVVNWKGSDPRQILSMCSNYCDVDGTLKTLDEDKRALFNKMVENIASDSKQCFAFAYKQVLQDQESGSLKPEDEDIEEGDDPDDDEKTLKSMEHGLTLLGLVSLKNPYSSEVKQAVEACIQSGVNIKLVVGDDVQTAKFMVINSGILRPGDDINQAVVEASVFRNSSEEDRMKMIDNIHALANASSIDKLLMAQCLRQKAEVVAVAGTCSRDIPALIEADVGLLVGDRCAECTKEDVDIVALGLNLGMISTLVKFGRCVCHNLEKFIELQLTVNVAAFTINFIVVISTSEVQFTAFHLLWVNLIMEVLGALALSIQMVELPPSFNQAEQPRPVYGSGRIITKTMSRNIAVQSLFQVTISMILRMKGKTILHVDEGVVGTMIFICYVLCQVFALVSAMKIKRINTLEGLFAFKNYMFLMIVSIIVIMQVVLIEIMAIIAHWKKLNLELWCICTGIASLTMFIDYAVNYW